MTPRRLPEFSRTSSRQATVLLRTTVVIGTLALVRGALGVTARAAADLPVNASDPPAPADTVLFASLGEIKQTSGLICGPTRGSGSDPENVNTDCDEAVGNVAPHNETAIAVNPKNPRNLLGGANDFQFLLTNGGALKITALSRAHVSFDAGASWAMYGIPFTGYAFTGDPAVAFDADGTAYYSTLGVPVSQATSTELNADVVVSHSPDGGKTWSVPSRVGQGVGSHASVSRTREDKDGLTAWGHGNVLLIWTNVTQGQHGAIASLSIHDAVSHDGGVTWSKPTVVSSSAPFCTSSAGDHTCDEDFGATPVYGGGRAYIAFVNFSHAADGHDQYLVSEVSPTTGALIAGPFQVAQLVDGTQTYPIDAEGRQTYQDSQFRTWSLGNLAVDPTNAGHLAVVWSDMRNSSVPLPDLNPYDVTTNSDVVVSDSHDAGRTWSPPVSLMLPNDQFMPWAVYDVSGRLRIGYFDRSYEASNHRFGYSLATETAPGALSFTSAQLTTQLSDPTTSDRWFSFIPVDLAFPNATFFIGDYSGIAADPSGGVVALWTDLRNLATFAGRSRFGEDVFFARSN